MGLDYSPEYINSSLGKAGDRPMNGMGATGPPLPTVVEPFLS